MSKWKRVRIGTLDVDAITFDEALREIGRLVEAKQGGAVFTPNVDHIMLAERNEALRAAYGRASLSLADGVPVVWASRLLKPEVPEKISGSDLVPRLMRLAGEQQWRVYLLGGAKGVALQAAEILREHMGVNIVGVDDSFIALEASDYDTRVIEKVRAVRPDLILVALGCPKQELFIDRNRPGLGPVVAVGIGASLDFVVGRVSRAPQWMSRSGLEWTYRLAQEPRRLWHRYLVRDMQFIFVILKALIR
ncbi:MAG: WecB/TagA/CpsF family glycosyltransferase [Phycisphaerae bacterium]|nr:WecB/TagA/CpsF family glycosyltransferase [Gemmatimonadaceae bacterium]